MVNIVNKFANVEEDDVKEKMVSKKNFELEKNKESNVYIMELHSRLEVLEKAVQDSIMDNRRGTSTFDRQSQHKGIFCDMSVKSYKNWKGFEKHMKTHLDEKYTLEDDSTLNLNL